MCVLHTPKETTTAPNTRNSTSHAIFTISRHSRLQDFQRLAESRDFEHVQSGTQEQVAELDGLLLELRRLLGGRHAWFGGVEGNGPDRGRWAASCL